MEEFVSWLSRRVEFLLINPRVNPLNRSINKPWTRLNAKKVPTLWWWVKFEIGQIWKYEGERKEEETASIYTLRWICFRSNLIKLSWWHSKFVYPAKFSIWFTSISLFKTGRWMERVRAFLSLPEFRGMKFLKGVVSPRFDFLPFLLLNGAGSHTDNLPLVRILCENFVWSSL